MNKFYLILAVLLIINNTNGQDWKWKNPLPTGNLLNYVKFIDSSTAIAIGNQGTILKSTDNGLNWNVQISGTNANLLTISVIDKDTLYISGNDRSVLKTIDGGNNWVKVFNGTSSTNNINQIFFVNPATGYLIGEGSKLFKTIDYGKTWSIVEVGLEFQQVTSIYFTNADTGYASVGQGICGIMLKTINGGVNWSTINLPLCEQFNSIVFTNDSTGYMVGTKGAILKTINSGNNWIIQNEFSSTLTFADLMSVDFINNDTGFIVGSRDILKTINGGDNWVLIAQSDFDLYSVSFVDSINGITVGGDWLYEVSGILISTNGGMNWNEISSTITTKYIDEIKFVNSDTGYAVGGHVSATYSGFIIKTTNAGDTWSTLNTGVNTYWLTDISIPDTNTIYVVAKEGQILKSSDAGVTWTEQNSNTSESLCSIHFADTSIGYAVGDNGTIIKTTDAGKTWINQISSTDKNLYSVYFKDVNTGFIPFYDWSIDSTILLTTADGGDNWNRKSIGTLQNPRGITFVNNDTAFIAGDFGGILKTTDGGNSWESSYHHGNTYLDIFFTSENTGYVVGGSGEISITENCGNDWTVLNSGTNKSLRSVFFTDVNTGYAVGSDGVILKTTNSGSSLKPISQPQNIICLGDTILIKPNLIGGTKPLTYYWNNSQTSSYISLAPENDTVMSVTITDDELDSIKIEIPVYVISAPTPEISQNGDTLISNIKYGNQWYRNDSIIIGANSDTYVPVVEGNYYSIVSRYLCYSEKSNIIQFTFGSVVDNHKDNLNIYPNPVSTILNFEFINHDKEYELVLLGITGQTLIKQKVINDNMQLDMSYLSGGIYLIQLITNDKVLSIKIIKE
jgi:photosystem II stability/assembly factor-like uncharacterized protein